MIKRDQLQHTKEMNIFSNAFPDVLPQSQSNTTENGRTRFV